MEIETFKEFNAIYMYLCIFVLCDIWSIHSTVWLSIKGIWKFGSIFGKNCMKMIKYVARAEINWKASKIKLKRLATN